MRLLVTGGCGYIGSATARMLAARGDEVVVLDDLSEGHRGAWAGELRTLDLTDLSATHSALQADRFDAVLHFAGRAYVSESVDDPLRYWRANLLSLLSLLDAIGSTPIVFSSSCVTYGDPDRLPIDEDHPQRPLSPYGESKLAAERLLLARAAAGRGDAALLRYFNAAGAELDGSHGEDHHPETRLIPLAIRAALGMGGPLTIHGEDWPTPDGTCIRDYTHICDLARAHLSALEHLLAGRGTGVWNLGTGHGASIRQVIEAVEQACGRPVPSKTGDRRPGDPAELTANPARAKAELGWSAEHDLQSTIASAVLWHQLHPRGYDDR